MKPIKLEAVQPVGTQRIRGVGLTRPNGLPRCEAVDLSLPRYPDETVDAGRKLQALRRSLGLSLITTALAFQVGTLDVLGMEQGRYKFDLAEAEKRLHHASDELRRSARGA